MTPAAMIATVPPVRFRSRFSSRTYGSMKWPTISSTLTQSQLPVTRERYQGISSGRFPIQMIRNCEKLK